jgi:hypothetical protein
MRKYFKRDSLLFSVIFINIIKDIDLNSIIIQIKIQDDLPIIKNGENKIKNLIKIFIKKFLISSKLIIVFLIIYISVNFY